MKLPWEQKDKTPPLTAAAAEAEEAEYLNEHRQSRGGRSFRRYSIAFSGGGIRSAAFCLGVLRTLAKNKALGKIDYLSTVSGGGYSGCFMSAWIGQVGLEKVQKDLPNNDGFTDPQSPLYHLRRYSNYLTPRIGFFSIDSLAGIALLVRNLALNWLGNPPDFEGALEVEFSRYFERGDSNEEEQIYRYPDHGYFETGRGRYAGA